MKGKKLNIIKSMYETVKSKVKYQYQLSEEFDCYLDVQQGESLSPFLFSMYLNYIEDEFYLHGIEGINIYQIKLFLLLYADDIHYFLKLRMAYRVDLMFYTIIVKSGDFLSILIKQRLLYLEKGGFCQKI